MQARLLIRVPKMMSIIRSCGLHIGLALLLVLPQPATALFLSGVTANPENLESRPSEECVGGHFCATPAVRCDRRVFVPLRRSTPCPALTPSTRPSSSFGIGFIRHFGRRCDQQGAGIRCLC